MTPTPTPSFPIIKLRKEKWLAYAFQKILIIFTLNSKSKTIT